MLIVVNIVIFTNKFPLVENLETIANNVVFVSVFFFSYIRGGSVSIAKDLISRFVLV